MPHPLSLAVTIALVSASCPALAAGKPSNPGRVMDKVELKICVEIENGMKRQTRLYNDQVKESNALVKKLDALRSELNGIGAGLDSGDKSRLDEYNAKVEQSNGLVRQYDDQQLRMGEIATEHDRFVQQFNQQCAGRRFLQSDLYRVKKPGK